MIIETKNEALSAQSAKLRARIEARLTDGSARQVRSLFSEINPHLVGDKLFESRWSDIRKDAAVLIPIMDRPGEPTLLMTVRSSDMPSHAGQISFPGGKVQAEDENRMATALREAEEEVSIPADKVSVVGELGIHEGGLGFSVTPVIGFVDDSAPIAPCPREVAEIFEVPVSYLANIDNHVVEERTHKGVRYNMFAIPYRDYHIWGLTAGILRSLAEVIREV